MTKRHRFIFTILTHRNKICIGPIKKFALKDTRSISWRVTVIFATHVGNKKRKRKITATRSHKYIDQWSIKKNTKLLKL